MLLARLRGNLVDAAHELAEKLRRDDCPVTGETIRDAIIFETARAIPRSVLIPWHLTDDVIEPMIGIVVADFFSNAGRLW